MLALSASEATAAESAADSATVQIKFYQYTNGLGAEGYDVVAYFEEDAAVPGAPAYQENFGGMKWQFASAKNRDKFLANPEKYLPRYGGHCAYGVASGYLVRGDPQAWSIRNGVLYLNYSKSIRRAWQANDKKFIARSEKNWPGLNR